MNTIKSIAKVMWYLLLDLLLLTAYGTIAMAAVFCVCYGIFWLFTH